MPKAAIYFAAFFMKTIFINGDTNKKYGSGKPEPYHHLTETLKPFYLGSNT